MLNECNIDISISDIFLFLFLFLAHFNFSFYFGHIFMQGEKITYLHVQDGVTIEKGPVNGDGRRPLVNTVQIPYKYHTNTIQIRHNIKQIVYKYYVNTKASIW